MSPEVQTRFLGQVKTLKFQGQIHQDSLNKTSSLELIPQYLCGMFIPFLKQSIYNNVSSYHTFLDHHTHTCSQPNYMNYPCCANTFIHLNQLTGCAAWVPDILLWEYFGAYTPIFVWDVHPFFKTLYLQQYKQLSHTCSQPNYQTLFMRLSKSPKVRSRNKHNKLKMVKLCLSLLATNSKVKVYRILHQINTQSSATKQCIWN